MYRNVSTSSREVIDYVDHITPKQNLLVNTISSLADRRAVGHDT